MSSTLDLWIRSAHAIGDDGLKLVTTRPSTFESHEYDLTSQERKLFADCLKAIHAPISTIEGLQDTVLVCSDSNPPLPLKYICNLTANILPDVFEPQGVIDAMGGESCALYAGDYWFLDSRHRLVTIERKRLENGELLSVLASKHGTIESKLTSQAKKMKEIGEIRFLLIELGYFKVDTVTGLIDLPLANRPDKVSGRRESLTRWRWCDVQKALTSLCDAWGLKLWLTHSRPHLIQDLYEIRSYLNKTEHSSQVIAHHATIIDKIKEYPEEVSMLCVGMGIGVELADRALQYFGSLKDALNAPANEWANVEGFGPVRIHAVTSIMNRKYPGIQIKEVTSDTQV